MKTIAISGIIANYEMESESNVTPATLSKSLSDAGGEDLLITINSPGGSVFAGLEMFSAIRNYPGNTETRIVSMAASMGSILALAGNKKTAERTAAYMIHNASGIVWGDHRVMAKMARELEAVSGHLSNIYTDRAGVENASTREMMNEETWMYGEELTEFGFEIVEPSEAVDMSTAKFEAHSRYNNFKANIKPEEFVDDLEKAAASISHKKSGFTDNKSNNATQPPASAGTTQKMEAKMDLTALLAANPEAKAQYDANIKAHGETQFAAGETAGNKAGKEEIQATVKEVSPFIGNAEYPEVIGQTALKVLNGEESMITLKASVAAVDAVTEKAKSDAAEDEQSEETTATGAVSTDEKTEQDFQARLTAKGRA